MCFNNEGIMFALLLRKELRSVLFSVKFVATFGAAALLLLLSIQAGITDYRNAVLRVDAARSLASDEMAHSPSWGGMSMTAFRQPDPLQVFVAGVANDVGRFSPINAREPVNLQNSEFTDNPLFALFRAADFSFIVAVVLSLFAILFTYDVINGEREQGTLALTFANPVSRVQYFAAKLLGTTLGLVIPVALAVLIGLLLVVLEGVPLSSSDWMRVLLLLAMSFLLFLFFIAFGSLVSALTQRSSMSFLYCLAAWILFVLVWPRAGMMAASLAVPVPSYAEVEGRRDTFAKDQWEAFNVAAIARWRDRTRAMDAMTDDEREAYRDAHLSAWADEDDGLRKTVEAAIETEGRRLQEDWQLRQSHQQSLGFAFALFSPASAYQIAAMNIAGTDPEMKDRTEQSMREYREVFSSYVERKQKESGGQGGMRITFDSRSGFKFSAPRARGTLDLSDMPRFVPPPATRPEVYASMVAPGSMIAGLMLCALAAGMAAFIRYDLR